MEKPRQTESRGVDTVKSNITVERYTPAMAAEWDAFVRDSRNGTFMLQRGYMDYHADRFADCSWIARSGGSLRALLPANITTDNTLHSHQGLTYGGWILPAAHLDGTLLLEIFNRAAEEWRRAGIRRLDYKAIPEIYATRPSQEDRYALFRMGARLTGCGLSTAVPLGGVVTLSKMQRRHLRDASRLKWHIDESSDTGPFMRLLEECLMTRHGVRPVHTAAELQLLRDRFPANIRIFLLTMEGDESPDAGVCVYDTGEVAHAQYIATTERARNLNLLTPLFLHLMEKVFTARSWFDFGISTEDNGHILNAGLLRQKCSFGGSGVIYPRYMLDL